MIRAYLGGSFNPIHQGHTQIAKEAIDVLGIETITLLPCKDNHLKQIDNSISVTERIQKMEQEIKKQPFLAIDYRELQSQKKHSFTIDTLRSLKEQHDQDSLIFVVGSDAFHRIHLWREWRDILHYCHLLVFKRANCPHPSPFNTKLKQWIKQHLVSKTTFLQEINRMKEKNNILVMEMQNPVALSSSQIRLKPC